ncbi:methyltransferase domain-containing protein [Streptomyces sp. SCSIO 30461]|uniref:methyltransferase domain-containing protein n=1 Tax=Streptomyces sp. SCSIO 30461 TaxID=3118085 RepID=UPI0030D1FCF6
MPIVTQWDDGAHRGTAPGNVPTSSASMPSVVYGALGDLDVDAGMQALDVGTGAGETAGLLAHRLGWRSVFTVDLDPAVSRAARERLCGMGLYTTMVIGDGRDGYLPTAPYDRILATYAVRAIPPAWIAQTRPGGVIVAPYGTHYTSRDAIVRLVVNGGTASGRFTRAVEFMKDRHDRGSWPQHTDYVTDWTAADSSSADIGPMELDATQFIIGLTVPSCTHTIYEQPDGNHAAWFYSLNDRSWAAVRWAAVGEPGEVYQAGPRQLWTEVEAAYRWWESQGQPAVDRFGLTITPGSATPWLDEPDNRVPRAQR